MYTIRNRFFEERPERIKLWCISRLNYSVIESVKRIHHKQYYIMPSVVLWRLWIPWPNTVHLHPSLEIRLVFSFHAIVWGKNSLCGSEQNNSHANAYLGENETSYIN